MNYQRIMSLAVLLLIGASGNADAADLELTFKTILSSENGLPLVLDGREVGYYGFAGNDHRMVYLDTDGGVRYYALDTGRRTTGPDLKRVGLGGWSPDNKKIAYFQDGSVYLLDILTKRNRRLIKPDRISGLAWVSNDKIVYEVRSTREDSHSGIVLFDISNGSQHELIGVDGKGDYWVEGYAPESGRLYYSFLRGGQLGYRTVFEAELVNGALVRPKMVIAEDRFLLGDSKFSVTGDGAYLVFTAEERNPRKPDPSGSAYARFDLYVLDTKSGRVVQVKERNSPWFSNWFARIAPNGSAIVVLSHHLDSGRAPRIVRLQYSVFDRATLDQAFRQ